MLPRHDDLIFAAASLLTLLAARAVRLLLAPGARNLSPP
ncbi:hypothetical protein CF161_20724 [Pseudomonas sp. CF161]|nr:hypothetical protein CF161_20724 [Pseudomonas sp. CF161]